MKIFISFLTLFFSLNVFAATSSGHYSLNAILDNSPKNTTVPVVRLLFENNCDSSIHLYLKHLNLNDAWEGNGPFEILPGETIRTFYTSNRYYYFGGYTLDGKYVWKGDYPSEMDDGTVLMLIEEEIEMDRSGDWTTQFYCE